MSVLNQIGNYLLSGGLFNPELMEHDKVRDMIMSARDENEKLKKALEIAKKTITILSDQNLGIGLAFKVHGTNLNAQFFIETTQLQYESGRQALKEIEEVLGEN